MLSNHYPLFFATKYNWLIVAIVLADRAGDPPLLQFAPRRQRQPMVDLGRRRGRHGGHRVAVGGRPEHADHGRTAAAAEIQASGEYRDLPLQHVPRRRAGLGRHSGGAEGRHARQRRTDSRCMRRLIEIVRGAVASDAARQYHRDDAAGAADCWRPGSRPARRGSDRKYGAGSLACRPRPASDLFARAARRRRYAKLSLHR